MSFYKVEKMRRLNGTHKNDVMRQAKFVGDSYSSKTTPFKYVKIRIAFFKPLEECVVQARS